jgi:predicted DCC family thiol-disulfide oxidoreductase YuxK
MSGMSIVLFDGVCNLCNGSVLFIIDRDPRQRFRFAPLQSEFAVNLLASLGEGVPEPGADSLVLVEDGTVYQRSDAALRIARNLRAPWPLLWMGSIVPRALRDRVYDFIARNRYRWLGREESCRIPTPALRERFLA